MKRHCFPLAAAVVSAVFMSACQQLPSIGSQRETVAKFGQYDQEDKVELIDEWQDKITVSKIHESKSHCCYLRFQHILKNLSVLVRDSHYRKINPTRYRKIMDELLKIADSRTDLRFMTDCMENQTDADAEVTNIRKAAISSLVALDDPAVFEDLKTIYADQNYEYPVQAIVADGLIKYLPSYSTDHVKAELIQKSMILKLRTGTPSEMKEIEHLLGMCCDLAALNEAIKKSRQNVKLLELTLEANLNFWREVIKGHGNKKCSEQDTRENVALLKSLVLPAPSKKVDDIVFFTLCEIVPGEFLAVLNARFEDQDFFTNLKNMLSFYFSVSGIMTREGAEIAKISDTEKIMAKTQKLSREFLFHKFEKLPIREQKEAYELYACNFPEQVLDFLCRRFADGDANADFYENSINVALWMIAKKNVKGKNAENLSAAIDKLLFSCRSRSDYRRIFTSVFSNKDSFQNLLSEMRQASAQGNIAEKKDFADCYIALLGKLDGNVQLASDPNFRAANLKVFGELLSSLDSAAVMKIIAFLEGKGEVDFLLCKLYEYFFETNKRNSSLPHLILAGDFASRHLPQLEKNFSLYQSYLRCFSSGMNSKDDDVSLACADYYFRLAKAKPDTRLDDNRKTFLKRWPQLREIPGNDKK